MYSLETIADTREKITCYTSPSELNQYKTHFANMRKNNMEFLPWDLYSFYFHNDVNSVRDNNEELYRKSAEWRDRCIEIMWGKFLFIKDVIKNNSNLEHLFWIDAGISHPGIIHSRFNPNYEHNIDFVRDLDKKTYPDTFKNTLIFNPEFMDQLIAYTGTNEILNIAIIHPQHQRLNLDNSMPFKGSVIGGLFGGNVAILNDYCDAIINMFEFFLNKGVLCKEEQIMTEILAQDVFPIKTFTFQNWYHPDWGENRYDPSQISFCDFFDEIKK
jgi:hypothetical protein